jgi:hypothetical protein
MFEQQSFQANKIEIVLDLFSKMIVFKFGDKFTFSEEIKKIKIEKNKEKIKSYLIEKVFYHTNFDINSNDYKIIQEDLNLSNLITEYNIQHIDNVVFLSYIRSYQTNTGIGTTRIFEYKSTSEQFLLEHGFSGYSGRSGMIGFSGYSGYSGRSGIIEFQEHVQNTNNNQQTIDVMNFDNKSTTKKIKKNSFIERKINDV